MEKVLKECTDNLERLVIINTVRNHETMTPDENEYMEYLKKLVSYSRRAMGFSEEFNPDAFNDFGDFKLSDFNLE